MDNDVGADRSDNSPEPDPGSSTPGAGRRWLLLLLALFPLFAMWSITTAMFGSPDEASHMIRAQSFSELDFSEPYITDGLPADGADCFRYEPSVTAACQDLTWGEPGTRTRVSTGNYPPLYHLVAAVPALITSGLTGAYVMRIWMAFACAALIAWAGVIATRPAAGPWPLVGLFLALTPTVGFVAGTVNPSGLAGAGAALFVSAMLAVLDRSGRAPDRTLLAALTVGASVLIATRRDGLIWLMILLGVAAPLLPWSHWIGGVRSSARRAFRNRTVVAVGGVLAVGVVAVGVFTTAPTVQRFAVNLRNGEGGSPGEVARSLPGYLEELIGRLGWLDTPISPETMILAYAIIGFVLFTAITAAPVRNAAATSLGVLALLAIPVVFGLVRFPYMQGRYLIPLWVGLALLAGDAIRRSDVSARATRRAVPLVLVSWLAIHVLGLVTNLRRYSVGMSVDGRALGAAEWSPPMMSNQMVMVLILVAGVAAAASGLVLLRASLPSATVGDGLRQRRKHR